jgi:hypothetical protein
MEPADRCTPAEKVLNAVRICHPFIGSADDLSSPVLGGRVELYQQLISAGLTDPTFRPIHNESAFMTPIPYCRALGYNKALITQSSDVMGTCGAKCEKKLRYMWDLSMDCQDEIGDSTDDATLENCLMDRYPDDPPTIDVRKSVPRGVAWNAVCWNESGAGQQM